jgi:hypothetical protein
MILILQKAKDTGQEGAQSFRILINTLMRTMSSNDAYQYVLLAFPAFCKM